MSVVFSLLGAFFDAFGRAFLDWLRERRLESAMVEIGASRERKRLSDEVVQASKVAGEIVAGRDDGVGARRLRDGEF